MLNSLLGDGAGFWDHHCGQFGQKISERPEKHRELSNNGEGKRKQNYLDWVVAKANHISGTHGGKETVLEKVGTRRSYALSSGKSAGTGGGRGSQVVQI